jgi:hypothetical protein
MKRRDFITLRGGAAAVRYLRAAARRCRSANAMIELSFPKIISAGSGDAPEFGGRLSMQ